MKNGAGSGARWLDVSAERFPGWIAAFAQRHGLSDAEGAGQRTPAAPSSGGPAAPLAVTFGDDHASFTAEDGSVADCYPPFPPRGGLAALGLAADDTALSRDLAAAAVPASPADIAAIAQALSAHARRPRSVGVLLVRLGGYAAGVFTGYPPALADAKVGSRLVHGRSAAGGWSQHRFARRREKQASEALDAAADAAVHIFGKGGATVRSTPQTTARNSGAAASRRPQPTAAGLDAVVLGGDRRAMAELRGDPRLAPYFALASERFLTVPDPKRAVLLDTPRQFTAVRIRLTEG